MSPQTAKALKTGDHIAKRSGTFKSRFAHVGRVTKTTTKAFYVYFDRGKATGIRIAFDDRKALANLRTADVTEIAGYERWAQ